MPRWYAGRQCSVNGRRSTPPREEAAGPGSPRNSGQENAVDITQLILDDHHEQRRLFAMLEQIDRDDAATLKALWRRLAAFLEVHAAAEEEHFYPALLRLGKGPDGNSSA